MIVTFVAIIETLLRWNGWQGSCCTFDLAINQGRKGGTYWLRLICVHIKFVFNCFRVVGTWLILRSMLGHTCQVLSFKFRLIPLSLSEPCLFEIDRWLHTILLNLSVFWMIIHLWLFSVHPIMVCALHLILRDNFLEWIPWSNSSFLLLPQHHVSHKLRDSSILIIDCMMDWTFFKALTIRIFSHHMLLLSQ